MSDEKPTYSRASHFAEYNIRYGMISRCHNPRTPNFINYGARGIAVCDRWRLSFQCFMEDVGPRPGPRHSLERKNNSEGYNPDNCKWATKAEQMLNRRSREEVARQHALPPMDVIAPIAAREPEKIVAVLALLRADALREYASIGAEVGVSRERVRQIAGEYLNETGRMREARRRAIPKPRRPSQCKDLTPLGFVRAVNRWYLGSGCAYCPYCHRIRDMRRGREGRRENVCAECGRGRQRDRNRKMNQHDPLYGLRGGWLARLVNRWVAEIGCRYCAGCHAVVRMDGFGPRGYCLTCECRVRREAWARRYARQQELKKANT